MMWDNNIGTDSLTLELLQVFRDLCNEDHGKIVLHSHELDAHKLKNRSCKEYSDHFPLQTFKL